MCSASRSHLACWLDIEILAGTTLRYELRR